MSNRIGDAVLLMIVYRSVTVDMENRYISQKRGILILFTIMRKSARGLLTS